MLCILWEQKKLKASLSLAEFSCEAGKFGSKGLGFEEFSFF